MPIDQEYMIQLEQQMDQAFAKNDIHTLRSLVHPDAFGDRRRADNRAVLFVRGF